MTKNSSEYMQKSSPANESIEDVAYRQNNYAFHLAKVNESNPVISTEDILNSDGALLVPQDTRISHDQTQNILQHKLLKPIEEQVALEKIISNDKVMQNITSLLNKYPDMRQIHDRLNFQPVLEEILDKIRLKNILSQKITVLSDQLTAEYEKSLLCAWLSALIAKEHNESSGFIEESFIAGLFHDIGFLHIPQDIVTKRGRYTTNEWRAVQCHVVIGQLLMKNMGNKYSNASMAIFEHHERCDGSGYPVGKTDENLNIMGQIIGISDSMLAIRLNRFENQKRNIKDIMSYLHMNSETHFRSVSDTMCYILKESGLSKTQVNLCGTTSDLAKNLKHRGAKLKNTVVLLEKILVFSERTKNCSNCSNCNKATKVTQPVLSMIRSSGLVLDDIFQWLDTVKDDIADEGTVDDIIEMDLMQEELYWQLTRICKVIDEFGDSICVSDDQQKLMNISTLIKNILSESKAPHLSFKQDKDKISEE